MNESTAKRTQRYVAIFVRWLFVGAATFALTLTAGEYIANNVLAKVYTASAVLQIPASELVTPNGMTLASITPRPEFENTMLSPELLLGVVKDLGLEKAWAQRLYSKDQEDLPDVDALTRIDRLVKVHAKRGTNLVEITAASDLPQEAADIANAIAVHYQDLRTGHGGSISNASLNLVRVVERAPVPSEPSRPRNGVDSVVILVAACVMSLLAASFVEMIMLFVRAGERLES